MLILWGGGGGGETNKVHYGKCGSDVLTLFERGYSFQLYCLGNLFVQNFTTLQFENDTWW